MSVYPVPVADYKQVLVLSAHIIRLNDISVLVVLLQLAVEKPSS
jgi:hypothetical protein